jgi:two-component system, OmpR family, KDP operon response regulator KdpE
MQQLSTPYRVLIVDDEPQILRVLQPVLTSEGYVVNSAETGLDTLEQFDRCKPDAIILDLGLPDMDGEEVIRRLRTRGDTPIVVLSARQEPEDKIAALDAGANDYVHKPFHMGELSARLRNAMRHQHRNREQASAYTDDNLRIEFAARKVTYKGRPIRLTRKEYDILCKLAEHAGQVVTHKQLLQAAWNGAMTDHQYVRIYVGRIRQKLEPDETAPPVILTEAGIGYRLIAAE